MNYTIKKNPDHILAGTLCFLLLKQRKAILFTSQKQILRNAL